jgi:hypothetical protein
MVAYICIVTHEEPWTMTPPIMDPAYAMISPYWILGEPERWNSKNWCQGWFIVVYYWLICSDLMNLQRCNGDDEDWGWCTMLMAGHNSTSTNEKQSNDAESKRNCRMKYELCRHWFSVDLVQRLLSYDNAAETYWWVVAALMDGHNSTLTNGKQSNDAKSGKNCRMKYQLCCHWFSVDLVKRLLSYDNAAEWYW